MADALELQARSLLSAAAVRTRAGEILDIGLAGGLTHFTVDLDRMDGVADAVLAVTRKAYPTLEIPFHARWRHFVLGGVDRWAGLAAGMGGSGRRRGAQEGYCHASGSGRSIASSATCSET